jgi:hypothetical protein
MKRILTRRDFIRTGSSAALGGFLSLPLISRAQTQKLKKSRVVLIRNQQLAHSTKDRQVDLLGDMMDQAVMVLFDTHNPVSAWQRMASPDDIVGLKTNEWHLLPTPAALEEVVKKRLITVGVREENIAVDDRGVRSNPVFKKCTALINMRPLRTHHWSGLGTLLKNYIMFVGSPFTYHGNACEKLGAIWHHDRVKGKTRLNILVMVTPLFHGIGPHHFSRKYLWPYGGLVVSADPVAADSTGARIIQAKRTAFFGEDKPISPPPHHILAADTRFGLGNSHPDNIELINLGWDADRLIS